MKRRKFLKFLGLSATIPIATACKPKSKGTFEPYVPEEKPERETLANTMVDVKFANGKIIKMRYGEVMRIVMKGS